MAYDPNLDKILKVGEINLQETKTGEARSVLHINVCRYGKGECKLGLKLGFKTNLWFPIREKGTLPYYDELPLIYSEICYER